MKSFRSVDRVAWSSHGGTATGKVVRKITSDTTAAGRTVRASEDDPQYLCAATRAVKPYTIPTRYVAPSPVDDVGHGPE